MDARDYAHLIALFPALGFLLNGLLGRRLGKRFVTAVALGTVGLSLLLALGTIAQVLRHPLEQFERQWTWIPGYAVAMAHGGLQTVFEAKWGVLVDPLAAVMLFVVCFVGFLIHVYSTGYMWEEDGYWRFFAYLNLFMAMMLTLVLANNLLMMFVGWEGVGLCSYLLIGYYYEKKSAGDAGKKAFVVNRVGDFGFALAVLFCLVQFGSLRFTELVPAARAMVESGAVSTTLLTAICLLFFLGATGKSAQIPLLTWLPDAMEGPTPVSALIHAATMVTSGIYMIARLSGMFALAPDALLVIAVVGAATALFAATIAPTQNDIKRVLAYSTVSQLGYMFLALGLGAFAAGVFHLMTHAFFKACLFLGSGAVIHAMHHEQDMRRMGGLKDHIPHTYRTFLVATLAIAGVFPLAGFFSKDEILWNAFGYGRYALWAVGILTAGLTAFYMFRQVFLTFFQKPRFDEHTRAHIHEVPPRMFVPLYVLAGLSIAGGWVGIPEAMGGGNRFHHFLAPVLGEVDGRAPRWGHGAELALAGFSFLWAVGAIFVAFKLFRHETDVPRRFAASFAPLYKGSLNKWYLDEIYDAFVVNPVKKLTAVLDLVDRWIVDGVVNGLRHLTVGSAVVSRTWDRYVVDGLVNLVGGSVKFGGAVLRRAQTGALQTYGFYFLVGVFGMVCFYLLLPR